MWNGLLVKVEEKGRRGKNRAREGRKRREAEKKGRKGW